MLDGLRCRVDVALPIDDYLWRAVRVEGYGIGDADGNVLPGLYGGGRMDRKLGLQSWPQAGYFRDFERANDTVGKLCRSQPVGRIFCNRTAECPFAYAEGRLPPVP